MNKNLIRCLYTVCAIAIFALTFRFLSPGGWTVSYQFQAGKGDKISKIAGITSEQPLDKEVSNLTISSPRATWETKLVSPGVQGVWVELSFWGEPKDIQLGVKEEDNNSYKFLPVYNKTLENLKWPRINEGEVTLWQKNYEFESLNKFVSSPSSQSLTATYNYDPANLQIQDSSKIAESAIWDRELRGSTNFFVYVKQGPLIVTVEKYDTNWYSGEDVLKVQVAGNNRVIQELEIGDDGIVEKGTQGNVQSGKLQIEDIEPGVYAITLKDNSGNGDIRIKSISVNQPKLVTTTQIFLTGNTATTLYTTSSKLTIQAAHKQGIQKILLEGSQILNITQEQRKFSFDLNKLLVNGKTVSNTKRVHQLLIPNNDVTVTGEGIFALKPDQIFDPKPIKSVDLTKLGNLDKVDNVLANYKMVDRQGDLKVAKIYLPLSGTSKSGKLQFALDITDLDKIGGSLKVHSLIVTAEKPSSIKNLNNRLKLGRILLVVIAISGVGLTLWLKRKKVTVFVQTKLKRNNPPTPLQ